MATAHAGGDRHRPEPLLPARMNDPPDDRLRRAPRAAVRATGAVDHAGRPELAITLGPPRGGGPGDLKALGGPGDRPAVLMAILAMTRRRPARLKAMGRVADLTATVRARASGMPVIAVGGVGRCLRRGALDQSARLGVLEALKAAEVDDRIRAAATTIDQALIEAELAAVIGAGPHERTESRTVRRCSRW